MEEGDGDQFARFVVSVMRRFADFHSHARRDKKRYIPRRITRLCNGLAGDLTGLEGYSRKAVEFSAAAKARPGSEAADLTGDCRRSRSSRWSSMLGRGPFSMYGTKGIRVYFFVGPSGSVGSAQPNDVVADWD
jgi:hypothetical protein